MLMQHSQENSLKAQSLSEITSLNSTLSNIVRNSYGIVYDDLQTGTSTDTMVLWSDKLEKNKIKIFVQADIDKDISRIFVQYNTDPPQALNSSNLFVKNFDITTSPNPKFIPVALEDQPWISVNIN